MPSEMLVELVYLSAARRTFTVEELRSLLRVARDKNRSLGITGLLLHADGSFLQVLEGPRAAVDHLYARIASDSRHDSVVRVFRREVETRSFSVWAMGFEEPVGEMRSELLGFTKILSDGVLPETVSARVRAIVSQFKHGRWRQEPAQDSGVVRR